MRTCVIACTCVFAGAATAQCPVSGDLEKGVSVGFEDGTIIEYRLREPGVVEEAEIDPFDGSIYYVVTERGILETEYFERIGGSEQATGFLRYEYDFDTSTVFPLEPGKTGGGNQFEYDESGEQLGESFVRYSVGVAGNIEIGACEYETTIVQLNTNRNGALQTMRFAYMTALGIAIVEGYYEFGEEPLLYTPVSISAIE